MYARSKVALLAIMLACLALPAAAQQPQPPGPPGMMMGPGGGWGRGPGMMGQGPGMGPGPGGMCAPGMMGPGWGMGPGMGPMMGGPGDFVEGRIAFLKAELKITPEQETVWKAYADAMREASGSMQAMHDQMMSGGMPATMPERMQWHEQMMASRLAAERSLQEAAVPLYKALSPEQKKVADSLIGMM